MTEDHIPTDIVPPADPAAASRALAGQPVYSVTGGEFIYDADGFPIGVAQTKTELLGVFQPPPPPEDEDDE